jgi:secreted trypsin-like serine protease
MSLSRSGAALAALTLAAALAVAEPAAGVVGGGYADAGRYPWLAAVGSPLFLVRPSGQFCGGALVAADRLVTAAHCVSAVRGVPWVLTVTFGRTVLSTSAGSTVRVSKIWVNPSFHETSFNGETVEHDDVAVLTLAQPQHRPVLKIASPSQVGSGSGTGQVLGWGTTSEGDFFNARLKSATVPLISDTACASDYGASFERSGMFCAGSPKADTCLFDSGGPLLVAGRLAGLTSWAYGCARPGYPGVYTRLPALASTLPG